MKAVDVHNLDDPLLVEFVDRSRQELFNLRFQHATGQLENTAGLKGAKRDLARGLTIAQQRSLDVDAELRKQRDDD